MNALLHRRIIGFKHATSSSSDGFSMKYIRSHSNLYKGKNYRCTGRYSCISNTRMFHKYGTNVIRSTTNHTKIISSFNIPQLNNFLTGDAFKNSNNNANYYFNGAQLMKSSFLNNQYRYICLNSKLYEQASSKVEVTVQSIKNKQKEEELKKELSQATTTTTSSAATAATTTTKEPVKTVSQPIKKPLQTRIWEEIVHYYHGFRLLFIDINICRKLLWRVLIGKKLTRRENRLLIRTTSDLFRLVPFSIFIIVPFLELLLPLFIKFFPGMLPSTFQTAKDHEDKLKQSLQVKLEVAKFLQKTLDEMAVQHTTDHKSEEAKEFSEFFRKIKNPNEYVPNEEIIKFSKSFEDEITLDSLSRGQLTALCRILELNTLGTNNFLRFQLRVKLRSLSADDRVIQREGVESLDMIELQQACKARGMRAYGLSQEKLRKQLQEWIDLSLNEKVPPVLLLLSRALMVPDDTSTTDKLKATISSLPDAVATQAKAAIGEREGKIDNKTKIEIIKEEVRKIKEEKEEEKEIEKEKAKEDEIRDKAEILVDKAPILSASTATSVSGSEPATVETKVVKEPEVISSEDVEVLEEALETLSKGKKKLLLEKETIKDLKEEIEEYKEDVEELQEITKSDDKKRIRETRAAKILYKKVNSMINNLDKVLTDLEKKEKKIREDIQAAANKEIVKEDAYTEKQDQLVRIDELVGVIKQLRTVSDESKLATIEKVLEKIDDDHDGQLKVDDVLKVIEIIGRDNVKLSEKQVGELVELFDKEEILEAEEKIEKALAKSIKEAAAAKNDKLHDKAPIISDKATDLSNTGTKDAQLKEPLEALVSPKDKVLPKTSSSDIQSTPTIPPPPTITPKQVNPKDKML